MSTPDIVKRRVVRGRQDRLQPKPGQKSYVPQDYSKVVADSTTGTLRDMIDANPDYQVPSDQYHDQQDVANVQSPTYKSVKFAQGSDQAQPPVIQIQKLNTPAQAAQRAGLTKQQIRRKQIQDVMSKYEAANKQAAHNKTMSAITSVPLALTNPQAARIRNEGYAAQDNEPLTSITGGRADQASYLKNADQTADLADQDQERDPDSRVSDLYRQQLTNRGITFTGKPSAADIKKVYPMIGAGMKQDTAVFNTQTVATTADQNRMSREQVAAKQRANAASIAAGHDKAGVGKVIIGGTMAQDKANAAGSGAAVQSVANSATIPDSYNPSKFLVSKPGMPPDKKRGDAVSQFGGQAARYESVLKQAMSILQQAGNNPTIFNQRWPAIQTQFTDALQRSVKFDGNGVANGPDIAMAIQKIGSPSDAITFIRSGLPQKMEQARRSARLQYQQFADGMGYVASDKPSEITTTMGTGGSKSSRQPVNPATAQSANTIAGQYGFPAVTSQNPSGTPDIPPQQPQQPTGTSARDRLKAKLGVK